MDRMHDHGRAGGRRAELLDLCAGLPTGPPGALVGRIVSSTVAVRRRRRTRRHPWLPLALLGRAGVVVVALVGLTGLVLTVLAALGLCRVLVVACGSMAPSLHPGDLVVSGPVPQVDLRPGQGGHLRRRLPPGRPDHAPRRVRPGERHRDRGRDEGRRQPCGRAIGRRSDVARRPAGGAGSAVGRVLARSGPGGAPTALLGCPSCWPGMALRRIWSRPGGVRRAAAAPGCSPGQRGRARRLAVSSTAPPSRRP